MTFLEIILTISLTISVILFVITSFYLFRFSILIIKIQDALEECIENLEIRQQSISKILEIPLFYDSLEIRRVLDEIKFAKLSIEEVAQTLGNIEETEE